MKRAMLPLALVVAGCSLRPPAPVYRFYVLDAVVSQSATPATDVPVLAVGRIAIPEYLDREAMVTRVGEQQVEYAKGDRWAEPLEVGIARTLRQDLAALLGPRMLVEPLRIGTIPDFVVAVDVERFERRGANEVELAARFSLTAGGTLVASGHTRRVEPTADESAAAAAAALSRALAQLAQDIAAAAAAAPRP